jgi:hypothetical protein
MTSAELGRLLPGLLALRLAALSVGDLTEEGGDVGGDAGNPGGSEGAAPRKRKVAVPRAHWGLPTDSAWCGPWAIERHKPFMDVHGAVWMAAVD